jgi:Ser/Thr protein kinase RdoA (MazF antagonist)
VLRVHRPGYHTLVEIESEIAWLRAVHDQGLVSTAAIVPDSEGTPVVAVRSASGGDRYVTRFTWLDGSEPVGARLVDDFVVLGEVAARLHDHARRWRRPAWFSRPTWDWAGAIGSMDSAGVGNDAGPGGHWGRWQDGVGVGPAESHVLARLAAVLRERLAAYGTAPDRFGLIHADMRLANVLVEPDAPPGQDVHVIDFDDCGFGWFGYDLAASLSFIEDSPEVPELTEAWVRGYRSFGPFSAEDEAMLDTFLLLRRLLLVAWIGSHQDAPYAASLGAGFTRATCDLAETFLSGLRALQPGNKIRP